MPSRAKVFDNVYFVGTKINSAWAIKTSAGIILLDTMYNYAAETEIVDGLKKLGPRSRHHQICDRQPRPWRS